MLNVMRAKSSVKNQGRIYTPEFIVKNILDFIAKATRGIVRK